MRPIAPALAGLLLCAASLPGYVRGINSFGSPYQRSDIADLAFVINDQTAAGMRNAQGALIITPSSDPLGAIRQAMETWNAIPGSRIRFREPTLAPLSPSGFDRRHLITFEDTAEVREVVEDATAVALFFSTQSGEIVDSDIYFNPALEANGGGTVAFSTDGEPDTFDIASIVLHELGHTFGMSHTNVLGATMFQFGRAGELFTRTLAADDIAFAVDVYPAIGGQGGFGRIRGAARLADGSPVLGGMVAAVNPSTGVVVGGLTGLASGTYNILVPPGDYVVYLEPLNGPVRPDNLALEGREITVPFQTTVFGAPDGGVTVSVAAGGETLADIAAEAGEPQLDIALLGVEAGQFIALGTGPRELNSTRLELFLWGTGLRDVTPAGLRLLGPDVSLVPGSVRFDTRLSQDEFGGALRFQVNVNPPSSPSQSPQGRSLTTVLVSAGGRSAALTGALVVEAEFPSIPAFTAAGVANAASFVAGPIAPGSLISIFGFDLGPTPSLVNSGFDPATGLLRTELGGVRVEFDGIAGPMFFASEGQINVQAPFEIAGRPSTRVVVSQAGRPSPGVIVPVTRAAPGLFVIEGTRGAILNQDFSLNTPANPARPGGAVIVFGTGQGVVSNPVPTGGPAGADPLSGRDGVTATVGGLPAQVLFAGLSPGFVGLLQVNLLLPADVPAGEAVPVQVFVDGVASQSGVALSIAE